MCNRLAIKIERHREKGYAMATVHTSLCTTIRTQAREPSSALSSHNSCAYGKIISRLSARGWCATVPFSGLVRCIFSENNGRLYCALRDRVRVRRSVVSVQCSSSSSSSSQSTSQSPGENSWEGFNPDDYEQKEETEEEARRRNWVERGWAPWEEWLSPEAQFAVDSLKEGEEEPAVSWEAFQKLNPKWQEEHRKRLIAEAEKKEKELEKLKPKTIEGTLWDQPLVFTLIAPRDWPPPGWKVDAKELAYIREAHALEYVVSTKEDQAEADKEELDEENYEYEFPRWKMFLKQYNEWVAANKDRLDQEAQEIDPEYYPGRRRLGEKAATLDDRPLYELPFIYPGQHYWGVVSCVNLYEGAFVFFGGVHDGWVPIQGNDWYHIRDTIKVGMKVQVEVLAKRDPYRFRFPIEMRFVDPNIDHMIFRRFEHPPIFGRTGDMNLDEVARDSSRPYYPRVRQDKPAYDGPKMSVHPAIPRLWQLHQAEQMVLDDEENGGIDYEDYDVSDFFDDDDEDEEDDLEEYPQEDEETFEPQWFENGLDSDHIPTLVLNTNPEDLNLERARAEREEIKRLMLVAESKGEEFVHPPFQFEKRVAELNSMHNQRSQEEAEALLRDVAARKELGLPIEEPGRYADKTLWGKNPYDPNDPRWRHDYWGDPTNLKDEIRLDREPRVAPTADETAAAEDIEEVEDDEETQETLDDQSADTEQSPNRANVNGTASAGMDDVRTMFTMQPEDYTVAADVADDVEVDEGDSDEDIAEGGGIDMPDTNR